MIIQPIKLHVRDSVQIKRKGGQLICVQDDLVVTTGFQWIAGRMAGTDTPITHMAVGTGVIPATSTDTGLEAEIARVALNISGGVASGSGVVFDAEFPAGVGTGDITEIALFNAASGGTMLCRTVGAAIAKLAGDALEFSWTVEITA